MLKKFPNSTTFQGVTFSDGKKMVANENRVAGVQQTGNCRKCFTKRFWAKTWKGRKKFVNRQKDWVRVIISKHQRDGIVSSTKGLQISTQKTRRKKNNSKIINLVNIRICDFNKFQAFLLWYYAISFLIHFYFYSLTFSMFIWIFLSTYHAKYTRVANLWK